MRNCDVAQYDTFARFYDGVNGEPTERIRQVLDAITAFAPAATSVLELGCGTGAVLAGLGSGLSLTGVDLSGAMLDVARRRCPGATFVEADITAVDLAATFDVAICVSDTLNHLTDVALWRALFENVARHLAPGGLFVFDLNTVGGLRELGEMAPWVHDFDDHVFIMDVDFDDAPLARWHLRVFEHRDGATFELHDETILELAVPLADVRDALTDHFTLLAITDATGGDATDESARALVVARRRTSVG